MKKNRITLVVLFSGLLLASCANILRGVVTPNQCKECAVISQTTGDTIQKFQGCGSSNVRIYEEAAVFAYEQGCDVTVSCRTWKVEDSE
ncbi:MAG: hypothetical protein HRT58_06585 [Crocinitomicaceae bacterium]|nr:hypothetical protein [Flavobacteriales bacterium]NQZ35312.1 hypothetical protein [Crocinitomicaceae bacterium]PHR28162.1 MAG: hypothetical protein COA38_12485 [Fluviicola sp.]